MEKVFDSVGRGHADGVLRVEDEGNFAVGRSIDHVFRRIDEESVAGHLAGKGFVRSVGNGMQLTCKGRVEVRFFSRIFWICRSGFGRFRSRSCRLWFRRLHRRFFFRLDIRRCFKIRFQIGFDDGDLRAVYDLYARPLFDDADGSCRFQEGVVDEGRIGDGAAEPRSAAVYGGDIFLAAQGAGDGLAQGVDDGSFVGVAAFSRRFAGVDVGLGEQLRFRVVVFAARRLKVEFLDEEGEDEIVQEEIDDAYGDDVHPVRLIFALENTKDKQVEEAAGESQAYGDVQHVGDHVGCAGQDDLHVKQQGRNEEEGKFNRFRNPREHRCQGC